MSHENPTISLDDTEQWLSLIDFGSGAQEVMLELILNWHMIENYPLWTGDTKGILS